MGFYMKIDRIFVYGFEAALYGMRNPKESWEKSDTVFYESNPRCEDFPGIVCPEKPVLGPNDMKLARTLIRAGTDHRKFLRQIMVQWNISIPRYIWQELDTYKVATVRNSCSTMHKLGHRDLELSDFQDEDVKDCVLIDQNAMGLAYRNQSVYHDAEQDKDYRGVALLAHMKRRLPEGFLQMATYSFSYETAVSMYISRYKHRMEEWSGSGGICATLLMLPCLAFFIDCAMESKKKDSCSQQKLNNEKRYEWRQGEG
jgi:hypothetical protein